MKTKITHKSQNMLLLLLMLLPAFLFSQSVGISTSSFTPDASSILEIKATDKGMLIPRIALTGTDDVTTIPSLATSPTTATGLLVYNTASGNGVTPGFYYWDGTLLKWCRFITGAAPAQPGSITGDPTACENTSKVYSIIDVNGATSYSWSVPTGWVITNGDGSISLTVTTGNSSQSGNVSVTATGQFGTSAPRILNVTISPTSVGGAVSGGTTICAGSSSAVLTLSGHIGTIQKWQSSVSPFSSWTDITSATTTTYSSGALTETTEFRAVVKSGSCAAVESTPTTVTVDPATVAGTVNGGATICKGSTSGLLTLSGHTGTVQKWQSSVSPFSSWTDITSATTTTYTSGALTETTEFRAVVKSGVCAALESAFTTVTVPTCVLGSSYCGGIAVYKDATYCYVVGSELAGGADSWGCTGNYSITISDGWGVGLTNTTNIHAACDASAAGKCAHAEAGVSWYLPSITEAQEMWTWQSQLPLGTGISYYWTSNMGDQNYVAGYSDGPPGYAYHPGYWSNDGIGANAKRLNPAAASKATSVSDASRTSTSTGIRCMKKVTM